jgi:hypothetical protein
MLGFEVEISDPDVLEPDVDAPVEAIGWVPAGLEEMEPGPYLTAILSTVDRSRLSGYDLVRVLQAERRMVAFYEAGSYRTMAEVAHCVPSVDPFDRSDVPVEFASEEIRAALTMTGRMADIELGLALDLVSRLPQVLESYQQGDLDRARVRCFATETAHLSDSDTALVADRLVDEAPTMTSGQLRRRLQRLVLEVAPDSAVEQRELGLEDRRIVLEANPDGTASVHADQLPPERSLQVSERINQLARSLKSKTETRTMDQLRADVFLDLLTGTTTKSGSARGVDITVDLKTLAELADTPGELGGYGPVAADIARQVAEQQVETQWTYSVTDDSGELLTVGTTRRRPTTRQRRWVQARDRTCVFPGCATPAKKADIDHRHPYSDGGATDVHNLSPLCEHHHTIKHNGWTPQHADGQHQWTSPLDHTYQTKRGPPLNTA